MDSTPLKTGPKSALQTFWVVSGLVGVVLPLSPVRPESFDSVRPELVVRQGSPRSVRTVHPEPVEGSRGVFFTG
jgi:hypothetical protein